MLNPEVGSLSKALHGKTPEEQLLFWCARTQLSELAQSQIQFLCREAELDWGAVVHFAHSHAVSSLLFQSLRSVCPDLIPDNILFELRTDYRTNLVHNLKLTAELVRVIELLQVQGVQAVAFKGPVLAQSIYGGTALRQMSDLDILVERDDFDAAQRVLTDDRYQVEMSLPWERHFVSPDGSVLIDLHPEPTPPQQSCNLPPEYWWTQLTSVSINGSSIQTFTAEAQIVMLFLHGAKDCWHKLSRICDVAELLRRQPDLDWEEVLELAQKHGYRRLVFWGLRLAHEALDAPLPESIQQQVYADPMVQMWAEEVYEEMFTKEPWVISDAERTLSFIRTYDRVDYKVKGYFQLVQYYFWAAEKRLKKHDDFKVPEESHALELERGIKVFMKLILKIPKVIQLKLQAKFSGN